MCVYENLLCLQKPSLQLSLQLVLLVVTIVLLLLLLLPAVCLPYYWYADSLRLA